MNAKDHLEGFNLIQAQLSLLAERNNGFVYNIETNETNNELKSISVLMHYANRILEYSFKIIGLDAGHMKDIVIDNKLTKLKKMFIYLLTTRLPNNKMCILAFYLCYSENSFDMNNFLMFLSNNGLNLNQEDITIITDRGSSIINAVTNNLPLAASYYCSKHLERNLKTNKIHTHISLFWLARNAVTLESYNKIMEEMKIKKPSMYNYLNNIEGWQLYKIIERQSSNMLHGVSTNNLVETVFGNKNIDNILC